MSGDVNDGCASAGCASPPLPRRVAAFIWNRRHLRQTDSLTTALVTEDTFERSNLFSGCRKGCVEGRIYVFFTATNEKTKKYKGALQIFTVFSFPLAPITLLFPSLSPISFFYFSCVYNVISAEDLTRSLSFSDSAGETLRNVP